MASICVQNSLRKLWTFIVIYALAAWYTFKEIFSHHKKPSGVLNQRGRVAIVTGGGRGIGLETVRQFLEVDMTVIIAGRDVPVLENSVSQLRRQGIDGSKLKCMELDLKSLTSVRKFADDFKSLRLPLHLLVNNAGIMFWPFEITENGFESHWSVNYLGHVLLTHLLWPILKTSSTSERPSRVVNLSSSVHYIGEINFEDINGRTYYSAEAAYAQSKLAMVMFTIKLDEEIRSSGENIIVNALHPGVVASDLFEQVTWFKYFPWLGRAFLKTPKQGSDAVVHVALSQEVQKGGQYYENCAIIKPVARATKSDDLQRLWELTCKQTNIDMFGLI